MAPRHLAQNLIKSSLIEFRKLVQLNLFFLLYFWIFLDIVNLIQACPDL